MNVSGKGIYVFGIGIALLSLVVERQVRSQNPTPPLGPNDEFTVAVNTSTIEAGPVFVADAGPQGPGFRVINGGVRNLGNGTAHAATNAETQMLNVIQTNPKVRMLLTVAEGLYRVIARKSAGIGSIADLRGKRITTVPNTSAHYHLVKMLRIANIEESDITIVNVGANEMAAAVATRKADAISMWEPEAENALEALGSDATVFQDNKVYRELFSLYTTTDVLNDARRRRELVAFVRALLASTEKVRNAPEDVIPLVAKAIKQPEEKVSKSWRFHAFPAALPADMLDVLTEEERWVAKTQQRTALTREQLATFIDTTVVREAQIANPN